MQNELNRTLMTQMQATQICTDFIIRFTFQRMKSMTVSFCMTKIYLSRDAVFKQ